MVFLLSSDVQGAQDSAWSDVWQIPLPVERRARHNYGLEKWLLCNAFLRKAVRDHSAFHFYILSDDDALYNATTLHARLLPFDPFKLLIIGNFEEWFMWDPAAMVSACFAYSSRRWEVATRMLAKAGGDVAALPRKHRECAQSSLVGPFPYAKGHLIGYSAPTARLLVSLFDCCGDEAYALGPRRTTPFAHPYWDRKVQPKDRLHPANNVLVEDVYYMHLLYKALGRNDSLTLLHLKHIEFVVERGRRALVHADVYHKLKRPERFQFIRARPELLLPRTTREGLLEDPLRTLPRCELLRSRYRRTAKLDHCCEHWTWCDYMTDL